MDNPETLATVGTQDIEDKQNAKRQDNTTQKTKKMSNTYTTKKHNTENWQDVCAIILSLNINITRPLLFSLQLHILQWNWILLRIFRFSLQFISAESTRNTFGTHCFINILHWSTRYPWKTNVRRNVIWKEDAIGYHNVTSRR